METISPTTNSKESNESEKYMGLGLFIEYMVWLTVCFMTVATLMF